MLSGDIPPMMPSVFMGFPLDGGGLLFEMEPVSLVYGSG